MPDQNSASNARVQTKHPTGITPKGLAFEFNLDQRLVRALLRRRFPRPQQRYWRFNAREAERVRRYLSKVLGNGRTRP
jgi:hypothetical protein